MNFASQGRANGASLPRHHVVARAHGTQAPVISRFSRKWWLWQTENALRRVVGVSQLPVSFIQSAGRAFQKRKVAWQRRGQLKYLERYMDLVRQINSLEPSMQQLTDDQLKAKTGEFRWRYRNGATLDSLLVEAFAVVREMSTRKLSKRHYDVQLLGGIVLHEGSIAEMATGEGKTMVAVLPAYLNALTGDHVHVVTVNSYLARRDASALKPLYQGLGLTVAWAVEEDSEDARRLAFASNVTYTTGQQLAFDLLRDQMAMSADQLFLPRTLSYAIVDEVDLLLLDNAVNPFMLSGALSFEKSRAGKLIQQAGAIGKHLFQTERRRKEGSLTPSLYSVNQESRAVQLDPEGERVAKKMWADILAAERSAEQEKEEAAEAGGDAPAEEKEAVEDEVEQNFWQRELWGVYLLEILKAFVFYKRDVEYVVDQNKQIVLLDPSTGRLAPISKYQNWVHQFIEAKEGLPLTKATAKINEVSYMLLFAKYKKLSGMTGTARSQAFELWELYKLPVVTIPPNKPCIRKDFPVMLFGYQYEARAALDSFFKEAVLRERPLLVGTASNAAAASLFAYAQERFAEYAQEDPAPLLPKLQLLCADPERVQQEARMVAMAGMPGTVTVTTNMAGRGTDVLLGGDPEVLTLMLLVLSIDLQGWDGFEKDAAEWRSYLEYPEGQRLLLDWDAEWQGDADVVRAATVFQGLLRMKFPERQGTTLPLIEQHLGSIITALAPLASEVWTELGQRGVPAGSNPFSRPAAAAGPAPAPSPTAPPSDLWFTGAQSRAGTRPEPSYIFARVCKQVIEAALDRGAIDLPVKEPHGFSFVLALFVWLQWKCAAFRAQILAEGGLRVVQFSLSPCLRLERQLRGRAGRQGDPGETYVLGFLDDERLQISVPPAIQALLKRDKVNAIGHDDRRALLTLTDVPDDFTSVQALRGSAARLAAVRRRSVYQTDLIVAPLRDLFFEMRACVLQADPLTVLETYALLIQQVVDASFLDRLPKAPAEGRGAARSDKGTTPAEGTTPDKSAAPDKGTALAEGATPDGAGTQTASREVGANGAAPPADGVNGQARRAPAPPVEGSADGGRASTRPWGGKRSRPLELYVDPRKHPSQWHAKALFKLLRDLINLEGGKSKSTTTRMRTMTDFLEPGHVDTREVEDFLSHGGGRLATPACEVTSWGGAGVLGTVITSLRRVREQPQGPSLFSTLREAAPDQLALFRPPLEGKYAEQAAVLRDYLGELVVVRLFQKQQQFIQRSTLAVADAGDQLRITLLLDMDALWKDFLMELENLDKGKHLKSYAQLDSQQELKTDLVYVFKRLMSELPHRAVKNAFAVLEVDPSSQWPDSWVGVPVSDTALETQVRQALDDAAASDVTANLVQSLAARELASEPSVAEQLAKAIAAHLKPPPAADDARQSAGGDAAAAAALGGGAIVECRGAGANGTRGAATAAAAVAAVEVGAQPPPAAADLAVTEAPRIGGSGGNGAASTAVSAGDGSAGSGSQGRYGAATARNGAATARNGAAPAPREPQPQEAARGAAGQQRSQSLSVDDLLCLQYGSLDVQQPAERDSPPRSSE